MTDVDFYLAVFKSIFLDSQNVLPSLNKSASHTESPALNSSQPGTNAAVDDEEENKSALDAQKKRVSFYSVRMIWISLSLYNI